MEEVCAISEPLVKVIRLVYLYEALDRGKESICAYYEGNRIRGVGNDY